MIFSTKRLSLMKKLDTPVNGRIITRAVELGIGINSGIALTYGMLAAETLGLGSCWIGVAQGVLSSNDELKELIGIKGTVSGVISIGYPKVKYYRFPDRPSLKVKGLDKI